MEAWLEGKAGVLYTPYQGSNPSKTCFTPHGLSHECKRAASSGWSQVQV